jgi:hypothetical protein
MHAVDHDDVGGADGMMSAVMTLAELQTTADEASPDDDRHTDNGVHADRIDKVWGESGHGRSAPLQPRPVHHDDDGGAGGIKLTFRETARIVCSWLQSLCEVGHKGFLMREIVIDTETTGLDPLNGDRIVELVGTIKACRAS